MFGDKVSICGPDQSPLSDVHKDLWNIDQNVFLNTFATNIGGPFWSIVAFLPLLDAGNRKGNVVQSSQVIATGSEAAYDRIPIPHYTYSASKAGLTHMMKQFATTFIKYKIRFNVIAPGRESLTVSALTMLSLLIRPSLSLRVDGWIYRKHGEPVRRREVISCITNAETGQHGRHGWCHLVACIKSRCMGSRQCGSH